MRRLPEGLRKVSKQEFIQNLLSMKEEEVEFIEKERIPKKWNETTMVNESQRKSLRW